MNPVQGRAYQIKREIFEITYWVGCENTDKEIETRVRPLIAEAVEAQDTEAITEVIKALACLID